MRYATLHAKLQKFVITGIDFHSRYIHTVFLNENAHSPIIRPTKTNLSNMQYIRMYLKHFFENILIRNSSFNSDKLYIMDIL